MALEIGRNDVPQGEAGSGSRNRAAIRLTRRGRVVLVLALAGLLVGGFALAASASEATPPASQSTVVVQPGDSLWSIAVREQPGRDPLRVVEAFRRVNNLDGYVVHPGQRLVVPADT